MFEAEANWLTADASEVPEKSRNAIAEFAKSVSRRTTLPWSEHCTECSWPTCYSTCTLYTPRFDLKCQRFADGMVRIDFDQGVAPYLLKIKFKRWAKLHAPGSVQVAETETCRALEKADLRRSRILQILPGSTHRKIARLRRHYVSKRDRVVPHPLQEDGPTHFAIECHNPGERIVDLSVFMGSAGKSESVPFERKVPTAPGYNRILIDIHDIGQNVDFNTPFIVEIGTNHDESLITLYFSCIDFVVLQQADTRGTTMLADPADGIKVESNKVKCVVWDLDNTIWDGILIEEGISGISLKSGIREVIQELDRRGILNSVASKNDHDDAMKALENFELAEYFLFPQISWSPKSTAIQRIATTIDIGIDTLLFVDDSPFERAEVSETVPQVRVMDAVEYLRLPSLPECNVPVTEESRKRRQFYKEAVDRSAASERFSGDYETFLRSCNIKIQIRALSTDNLTRVYELTQRTNQMNFSGNRYTIAKLEQIMSDPTYGTFVVSCEDRFGKYGIIGFCIVHDDEPRMTDLMFSCRIQNKRVDHAVLRFVITKYRRLGNRAFYANFLRTQKNAAAGVVFEEFGFVATGQREGVTDLIFPADMRLEDDGIVAISEYKTPMESS